MEEKHKAGSKGKRPKFLSALKNDEALWELQFILGTFLFVVGMAYFFKGRHPYYLKLFIPDYLKYMPDIPDFLILKWEQLTKWTDPYFSHQGLFGCWIIFLGITLRHWSGNRVHSMIVKFFSFLLFLSGLAICVMTFALNVLDEQNLNGKSIFIQVYAVVAPFLLGHVIGAVLVKEFQKKKLE